MLRTAVLRCARQASIRVSRPITQSVFRPAFSLSSNAGRVAAIPSIRFYSAHAGLAKDEVEGRILDLLKNFDKVSDASKLSGSSHFTNDLGLDSLDTVEVVMAIEEEFSIEIPDKEADAIHSVNQAVDYILGQPDAH
ncbi:mitochondrial acyl carrier protein [Myriangium duriaei CBS 260.36]|uniref:Acyl carrier protein n=1 Tax=Myriangium duriaei CBS 260.36 TaxID=1168546 RepID=A0A9P4MGS6_9PEZI|nr:mitochondrial acyl carrier protein [Myriangium duriaei CBS 260.36]